MVTKVMQLFPTKENGNYKLFDGQVIYYGSSIFAIERQKKLAERLSVQAVYDNKLINVDLIHMQEHFYRAIVPNIGVFYFMLENPRNVYTYQDGKKISLSVLTPVNEEEFERACREHHFFFVG